MYFENRSAGGDWQWLSTGIADMLITDLGRSERLLVVERERLSAMLQELRLVEGGLIDPANAAKVGQVTKVDWVLFGSFEKKGDALSIEGHILEVKSGQLLRVEQVKGKAEEVLALEKQLAAQLLGRLDLPLTEEERKVLERKPTDSLGALTHYYQGVEAYELGDYHRALTEFRVAGRQDPRYLEARVQAAEMYSRIEEPKHALVEYRRLTDADRDRVLPAFVYYGLGRLLEARFQDYEAALAAYRIITDRYPEFSAAVAEEGKPTAKGTSKGALIEHAGRRPGETVVGYAGEQEGGRNGAVLPCLAMMREGVCHEALGQDVEAARTYLVLDSFLRVHGVSDPALPPMKDKAAQWYRWAVQNNHDSEVPAPGDVSAMPADGETVELKLDPAGGGRFPSIRKYIAPRDREVESLALATVPGGWLVNPTPETAKAFYHEVNLTVSDIATGARLMHYTYPYGGRSSTVRNAEQGVSVTESPGTNDGRDYLVTFPPGVRGVEVWVWNADCRVQFTTRPWKGRFVPREVETTFSGSIPLPSVRISVHPTGIANLFVDDLLVYDPQTFGLCKWQGRRRVSSSGLFSNWVVSGDETRVEHTAVAVWPDGQLAERSWTASAGQTASIVLSATGTPPERRQVAKSGSFPCLLRDRRGTYWLVWTGSGAGAPDASAVGGAGSLPPSWAPPAYGGTTGALLPAAREQPSDGKDLYCCFSRDGRIWSVPRRLPLSSPEDDGAPTIRQDSQGTYWLLWVSDRDPADPDALWLASSLDGRKWTYPQKVKLPVPEGSTWREWSGNWQEGPTFVVAAHDRFWVGGAKRLTWSEDRLHWAKPMEIEEVGYGGAHSLGCDPSGRLLLIADDIDDASNPRPPLLYVSKEGAQWTKVAELDGGFQPDKEGKLPPKQNGARLRVCRHVEIIQNSDGVFLMKFNRTDGALSVGWSRDCTTWGDPLLVEPPAPGGVTGRFESTIAPGGPGRCVVAFASDEGIFSLLCQLPYATAGQELAVHPPITGPLEAGTTEKSTQPTILVLPFQGEEKGEQAALGEALAEVLTIDLARQEGVSVVDRAHLASVLQEQKLSLSGLVDQAAQLQVGKLLGARLLLAGSLTLVQGKLAVTAHLFDVSTAQLVKSEEASGEVSDWLEVEKPLALALAKDLNLKLDEVQVRAIDEKPEVNLHFIRGLGYYYANRHDEAIMEFLNTLFGDEKYVDARYWMARSYLATGEPEHARLELDRIVKEYPGHPLASESRGLLGTLPVAAQGSTAEKKP